MEWLAWLLDSSGFKVPTACGGWSPALAKVTVFGNLAIWVVYTIIPALIVVRLLIPGLVESSLRRLSWLFASFICWCGLTHLSGAAMFAWPEYRLNAAIVLTTAIVSWITVVPLVVDLLRWVRRGAAVALLERANESLAHAKDALGGKGSDVNSE